LACLVPERSLKTSPTRTFNSPVGVWLGVHGDRWVENAIDSVERQTEGSLDVVVALNGPSSWAEERLTAWQHNSRHAITVVINDRNLGPLGSWYANRDLIRTPWVALLHQDDVYLEDHISTLAAAADSAPHDVIAVFTTMDGVTEDGTPQAAPPMRNRHLDLAPSAVTVQEIIRRHPLPTPASALRNPGGYVDGLAWYDSGAPDSEWFVHLACRGRFRVLDDVSVLYRQPATSESSQTGWESRAWQWAQSLDRFIQSEDFGTFIGTLNSDQRTTVAQGILDAIPARYPTSPAFAFLQFAAAQRMAEAWDYAPGPATDLLLDFLAAGGESAATRNLESVVGPSTMPDPRTADMSALLGAPPQASRADRAARRLYRRYGHWLPRWCQEAGYSAYDRLRPRRGAQ
jgi:hypothetical protein